MRDEMEPIGINPNTLLFQEELTAILFPAGMLVPVFTIPLLGDALPLLMGRWRIKGDTSITKSDAVRMLRPADVDFNGPYTEFVINLFLIAFASWVSPGRFLITLCYMFCAWVLMVYFNTRMNVLRWQARTYFGGKQAHTYSSFLLAFPLGFLCAAMEHQVDPENRSGVVGLLLHMSCHFVFVKFVLAMLEPPKRSLGTSFSEMMKGKDAPVANYRNTNPIEVLKAHFSEPRDERKLVFFRDDLRHLQNRAAWENASVVFEREDDCVQPDSLCLAMRTEVKFFLYDLCYDLCRAVVDMCWCVAYSSQRIIPGLETIRPPDDDKP